MPCKPSDLSVTPPDFDEPSLPGFGFPTVTINPKLPTFGLPDGFPEDLLELLDTLKLVLPGGALKPNLSAGFDKTILDGIVKLLDYLTGFMTMFRFILPILNMILCIIEILCALTNPIKLIKALIRLFRTCIPDFLALFPVFAIIVMIISLILLIIALIEYIISEILRIINLIIRNIKLLARVAKRKDAQGVIAVLHKIGAVLCLFQNILAVLQIVAIIIQIIKDILKLGFRIPPCDDSNQDNDGCCTADVCPAFIKAGNYTNNTGTLQYYNQVSVDSGLVLPPSFGPLLANIRLESWQFHDAAQTPVQAFYNITQPFDVDPALGLAFFPQGKVYTPATKPGRCPYTLDMRLFYDPAVFGAVDPKGARWIRIVDAIVQSPPTKNLYNYTGAIISRPAGVVNLVGGNITEDDGTTVIMIAGQQATINSFIHQPNLPTISPTDGVAFSNVTYTFKINHAILVGEQIITLGCVPSVDLNKQTINAVFSNSAAPNFAALNNDVLPGLPDINGGIDCMTKAITKYRANVTLETTAIFQADTMACLNTMLTASRTSLGKLVDIGFVSNKSSFTVTPKLQFTTKAIIVSATIADSNGANICQKLPQDVADGISAKLIPNATFGDVSPFIYDGVAVFNANITSKVAGAGTIQLKYNNNFFNTITIPIDLTVPPTITLQTLDYTFIQAGTTSEDGKVRRDEGDDARDISGK